MIALGITFLWSCNVEESLVNNEPPQPGDGKLTFVLPSNKTGSMTYAPGDPVQGSDAEYVIHNLRIYWFVLPTGATDDADHYVLFKRFGWGGGTSAGGLTLDHDPISFNATAHKSMATIAVGDSHLKSRFYIVANVNDTVANECITSWSLSHLLLGITTAAEFEKIASSDAQPLEADGVNIKQLKTPLPMSLKDDSGGANKSAGGYVEVDDPAAAPVTGGSNIYDGLMLKRRVARFDIVNTSAFSNFHIKNVVISKARNSGLLHDIDRPAGSYTWNSADSLGKLIIDVDTLANGRSDIKDSLTGQLNADGIDKWFDTHPNDTAILNTSVFYLYPTVLEDNTEKTEILLEGVYNESAYRLFKLDLTAPIEILANKVYRINVLPSREKQLEFKITVLDWIEVDTVQSNYPDTVKLDYGILKATTNNGKAYGIEVDMNQDQTTGLDNIIFEYASSDKDSVIAKIVTKGYARGGNAFGAGDVTDLTINKKIGTKAGDDFEQIDLDTMLNTKIVTKTVTTYAVTGTHYETTHLVYLPPTVAPIDVTLQLTNNSKPQESKTLTLRSNNYARTGYKPVRFRWTDNNPTTGTVHELLWAPVNVGATDLPAGTTKPAMTADAVGAARAGNVFQWGRNHAYYPFGNLANKEAPITGPRTPEFARDTVAFIKAKDQYTDWASQSPDADDLWGSESNDKAKQQGPCPQGWRLPSNDEIFPLLNISTKATVNGYRRWIVTNPVKDTLYIPIAGFRGYDGAGPGSSVGSLCDYWTYSRGDLAYSSGAWQVSTGTGGDKVDKTWTRAYGFYIRAVREKILP
jgi:hypothetical protein